MKYLITLIITLFAFNLYSQKIQINGDLEFDIQNVTGAPIVDSVGVNQDSATVYNMRVPIVKKKTIRLVGAASDTTIMVADTLTGIYLTGKEINDAVNNNVANIATFYSRSLFNTYNYDQVITKLGVLNGFTTSLGFPTVLQQQKAQYQGQITGYWGLDYNSTIYNFNVVDGAMTEIEKVPGQDSVQVKVGGFTGNIQFVGPSHIRIIGLPVGTIPLGTSPGEEGERYVSEIDARVEFKRYPEKFQSFGLTN